MVCSYPIVSDNIPIVRPEITAAIEVEPALAGYGNDIRTKLGQIAEYLLDGQDRLNVTAIRTAEGVVRYHIADSVALMAAMEYAGAPMHGKAADIGTGGGFPLVPVAVLTPGMEWTGIESVQKKARFVEEMAGALQMGNVRCLGERAEDAALKLGLREDFDVVTSRAVGNTSALLEVSMPLLKVGGYLCMFKTQATEAEWNACASFVRELGGEILETYRYSLAGDAQDRLIYCVRKIAGTPENYPRKSGNPFKKPRVVVATP